MQPPRGAEYVAEPPSCRASLQLRQRRRHRERGADSIHRNGAAEGYELRFRSLFDEGRGYAFPCDAVGRVDLDALSQRARSNYFYARALVGRDFSVPAVQACTLH